MPYSEENLISISLLQHFVFCHRRAALVGIEQVWEENISTISGEIMHERAHSELHENRGDTRIRNSLRICSLELGVTGIADVVEFHRVESGGIKLADTEGEWLPFPIEYKRGSLHEEEPYKIQLCAQALCFEEMLHTTIPKGAIYWGETRRRQEIEFDLTLRSKTVDTVEELRKFLKEGRTPAPRFSKRCKGCSLYDICMPEKISKRNFKHYMSKFFRDEEGSCE